MQNIGYTFAHKRILVVEEIVEQWQIDHRAAMFARDVEWLVEEAAALKDPLERTVRPLLGGFQETTTAQMLATVHTIAHLIEKALTLFEKVRGLVRNIQRQGYTIGGAEAFELAQKSLERRRAEIAARWPFPDRDTVDSSRHDFAMGKFRVL